MSFDLSLKNKTIYDEKLRWVEIYKITNNVNQKVYIGQSVSHRKNGKRYTPKGMEGRFKEHLNELNVNHKYHCNALNNAIRTYGSLNFTLSLIRICSLEDANVIETDEIKKNNSLVPNGYNINTSCNNLMPSKTLIEKISKGNVNNHLKRHLLKFKDYVFNDDEENFYKYITPRNKHNVQIGWYLRLNKIVIEFISYCEDIDNTKKRAFDFLKMLKKESCELQRRQIAGSSLEPLLPLTFGNNCEELG
jgi:hypothetical protein